MRDRGAASGAEYRSRCVRGKRSRLSPASLAEHARAVLFLSNGVTPSIQTLGAGRALSESLQWRKLWRQRRALVRPIQRPPAAGLGLSRYPARVSTNKAAAVKSLQAAMEARSLIAKPHARSRLRRVASALSRRKPSPPARPSVGRQARRRKSLLPRRPAQRNLLRGKPPRKRLPRLRRRPDVPAGLSRAVQSRHLFWYRPCREHDLSH